MNREQTLDLSRLLGFDQVADASTEIDFQDDCVSARLGAKRGAEPAAAPADDERDAKG